MPFEPIAMKQQSPEDELERLDLAANRYELQGLDRTHAWHRASLDRFLESWPTAWGDNLKIVIYGEFTPPAKDLAFPTLGITINREPVQNFGMGITALDAVVTVNKKTMAGLVDAAHRINTLLGAWTLLHWGNGKCNWWSHLTHPFFGRASTAFDNLQPPSDLACAISKIEQFPTKLRSKVEAALFWIRASLSAGDYRNPGSILITYTSYWNAFECLLDAICICRPQAKTSKSEKQDQINQFLGDNPNRLTASDIAECYRQIVSPGLLAKARHALNICFPTEGEEYVNECFLREPRKARLYDVRNAINHGDIDAENPDELMRVEARLHRLWMIVWKMFGRLIPFGAPVDPKMQE